MRFIARHLTRYRYSAPIVLGPHLLRLTPRPTGVTIESSTLDIHPAPVTRHDGVDGWGNPVTEVTFAGDTTEFRIESRFVLTTHFPGMVGPNLLPLPWRDVDGGAFLPDEPVAPAVADYARRIAAGAGGAPLAFLEDLTQSLFTRTDRRIRIDGYARSPEETLATATGACRDLAMLFIAAARSQGIPARFVSGYQARAESVDGQRHLHAWPEVLIPGHGWHGYDPTHGFAVTDGHVALCAAPDQAGTMPVSGGYFGPPVTATLDYDITIDTGAA